MLTRNTLGIGLNNSLQYKGHNNSDLLVVSLVLSLLHATTARAKRLVSWKSKKQPLPRYLHAKTYTSNCCILVAVATVQQGLPNGGAGTFRVFKVYITTSVAESESRESKVFYGGRTQSRSRKKDFFGVGVRVEKYVLDSQRCTKI